MKSPNRPHPGAAELLRFADLIQGHARRLESLATWRESLDRHLSAIQAGESPHGADYCLRLVQARRDSGEGVPDVAFLVVCQMAERHADTIWDMDPELNELCDEMRAIEEREGLTECDEFDPDDPETPADWKALNAKSNRRYQEVVRISGERFLGWLRRNGENEIADLFLKDRAEYDRRREAGRFLVFGPQPDISAGSGKRDMGVTQVATGQK